jgi:hypothetical protein
MRKEMDILFNINLSFRVRDSSGYPASRHERGVVADSPACKARPNRQDKYVKKNKKMKERCTSDTATQSVYMSQVVYSPQYTTVNNAMTGASITSLNTTTQTNYNGSVNYLGQSASISKTLSNLQSGIPVLSLIHI